MASGTDGNIISYDASGNPVAVATGNDGQVLTSAGAGAPPVFETLPVGGITMAQQWRINANFDGDSGGPINSIWEIADTNSPGSIGSTMSQSGGKFAFPSTGIYFIAFQVAARFSNAAGGYHTGAIQTTINNSSYSTASAGDASGNNGAYQSFTINYIFDVEDASTHKVQFTIDAVGNNQSTLGNSTQQQTGVTFIRLGDT